ncbi:MAG: RIP metalloprotease RseP [Desulfobacteraceae bacterium]|nr:MAG: RIP metalloprotease RseP [Desulfobacteraceae bacterium]
MSTSILAFVIVLGILIFFHELGHFLMARLFGVGVEKFSLGFGPRIFGKKVGLTDYRISAIPLGGYVKMVGEEPDAEIDPADIPLSFTHKHVLKRILIVAAGPLFNLLLAAVIFFALFQASGLYILQPSVGKVQEGSPAEKNGLKTGDVIKAIDGHSIESWDDMSGLIGESAGKPLSMTVKRGDSEFVVRVTPNTTTTQNIFGEETKRYVIGIVASGDFFVRELGFFEAMGESVLQTYRVTELTVLSIVKLIQGTVSTKTLGGPIMIAEMAGRQAKEGIASLVFFIALLSVNLAILNFLPIPVLDGGHLLFFFIEALIGRPVNTRMREIAQQVGIFILVVLMVFVFYNDISRIFFS